MVRGVVESININIFPVTQMNIFISFHKWMISKHSNLDRKGSNFINFQKVNCGVAKVWKIKTFIELAIMHFFLPACQIKYLKAEFYFCIRYFERPKMSINVNINTFTATYICSLCKMLLCCCKKTFHFHRCSRCCLWLLFSCLLSILSHDGSIVCILACHNCWLSLV